MSGIYFHIDGECPCGSQEALCGVEGHPHGPHGHPHEPRPGVAGDDGSCRAVHPSEPDVLCGRVAGHGPRDMHDSGFFGGIPHLWPNVQP